MTLDSSIVNFFLGKGYKPAQARGIAAGIFAESANDHKARNPDSDALGLGQWLGSRKRELVKRYGPQPTKTQQLEFLHDELQGGDHGGASVLKASSEPAVLNAYVKKFMRPAAGSETSGDIKRGRQALGLRGGDRVSTYDRATAPKQDAGPSLAKVYQAYKAGRMSPQEAAQFENDVQTGAVMLPRGSTLKSKPAVTPLPAGVIRAYNSREMSDEDRAAVEQDLRDGVFALPRGAKLQAPAARTNGEAFGLGVRGLATGLGSVVDLVGAPINNTINMLTGSNLSATPGRDLANAAGDAIGLARPETASEDLNNAIIEGATGGLVTAGGGLALSGARGVTGAVAKTLASAPVIDTVSGATSGASSEVARQAGAGPVGQLAAGLAGGGLGIGAGVAAERILARAGRNAGKDIAEVVTAPKSAVIDEAGNLTDDGIEIATQNGITPDELKQAYGEVPPGVANDVPTEQVAARAVGEDLPIEQIDSAPPVRATPDEAAPPVQEAPTPTPKTPEALPETALARVQEGQEVGVDYSRGQATKNFDVQDAEARLRNSNGPEAEDARQFVAKQQSQVKAAVEDLQAAFGDPVQNATDRGEMVKAAIRELRDQGKAGVTALYKAAADLGGDELALLTNNIEKAALDVQISKVTDPTIKAVVDEQMARHGLIGKAEKMNERGITKVVLDDGSNVQFRGEVEPLTAANAEQFRQALNAQYAKDTSGSLAPLKRAIDDAVEEALESATVRGDEAGPVGAAYKRAREAHQQQKKTFSSKDVVQQVIDLKKGTNTEAIDAAKIFDKIFDSKPEALTNLKKIKAVLLDKPTPTSRAAWRAIQANGIARIFDKAVTRTTNAAGEITDAVSGAKLRSAITEFGPDKLKVLLDPEQFGRVMKLRRVIEDVTIPISGTTNPSGSGNLIMRLLKDADNQVTAAFSAAGFAVGGPGGAAVGGVLGRQVAPAIRASREAKAAKQTMEGLANYTPEAAALEVAPSAPKPTKTISEFIETYSSPRILTPVLAASQGESE